MFLEGERLQFQEYSVVNLHAKYSRFTVETAIYSRKHPIFHAPMFIYMEKAAKLSKQHAIERVILPRMGRRAWCSASVSAPAPSSRAPLMLHFGQAIYL